MIPPPTAHLPQGLCAEHAVTNVARINRQSTSDTSSDTSFLHRPRCQNGPPARAAMPSASLPNEMPRTPSGARFYTVSRHRSKRAKTPLGPLSSTEKKTNRVREKRGRTGDEPPLRKDLHRLRPMRVFRSDARSRERPSARARRRTAASDACPGAGGSAPVPASWPCSGGRTAVAADRHDEVAHREDLAIPRCRRRRRPDHLGRTTASWCPA